MIYSAHSSQCAPPESYENDAQYLARFLNSVWSDELSTTGQVTVLFIAKASATSIANNSSILRPNIPIDLTLLTSMVNLASHTLDMRLSHAPAARHGAQALITCDQTQCWLQAEATAQGLGRLIPRPGPACQAAGLAADRRPREVWRQPRKHLARQLRRIRVLRQAEQQMSDWAARHLPDPLFTIGS